jgi:hypothetical protein
MEREREMSSSGRAETDAAIDLVVAREASPFSRRRISLAKIESMGSSTTPTKHHFDLLFQATRSQRGWTRPSCPNDDLSRPCTVHSSGSLLPI